MNLALPLGRRTLLTLPNGVSTAYVYDLGSRLTALVYRNALGLLGDLTYSYDAAGNRVAVGGAWARTVLPDSVPSATYDGANRQIAFADKIMSFDDNGNLTTLTDPSGTSALTWDTRNRLTAISGPSLAASFAYDALARRAAKTINGQATTFLYEGLDVALENGANGVASYLRTLAIDEALVRTDPTGSIAYLADALGSTVALTDATGATSTSYAYTPFGDTSAIDTPSANAFQFTGRENDGTGLYYHRARYYHPRVGRFISSDPLTYGGLKAEFGRTRAGVTLGGLASRFFRDPDAHHGYAYAAGDPMMNTDPLGWQMVPPQLGGAFRGIGAGVGALHPGGTGAMIGAIVFGTAGALAGTAVPFPGGAIGGGLTGALVGGSLGGVFDNPCAGLPNCGEAEDLRRWREKKEVKEIQRDLERAQQLLDRLNRITDATMDILQPRAKP